MVHRSLRTAHRFRLIAHRFRLTAHRSSLTAHRFPSHRSSLIAHRSSFSAHRSLDANCGESQGFPYSYQSEPFRSEEHTSELQSRGQLVCLLLLEKNKI